MGPEPGKPGPTKRPIWPTAGVSVAHRKLAMEQETFGMARLVLILQGLRGSQHLLQGQESTEWKN